MGVEIFDIMSFLWTAGANLKFHGVWNCLRELGFAEFRTPAQGVSCISGGAQSWGLRSLSKAVAQAESHNPASCVSGGAQSGELRKQSFTIAIQGVA